MTEMQNNVHTDMNAVYGVLCRILWYSSLAFNTDSSVTFEFTTPRTITPDGVVVCSSHLFYLRQPDAVTGESFEQGGNIWLPGEARQVSAEDWGASPINQSGTISRLRSMKVSEAGDDSKNDPYDATRHDEHQPLEQNSRLFQQLPGPATTAANSDSTTSTTHCLVLSGGFKANTRYQVTLTVANPPPPANSTAVKPPDIWLAPLTYKPYKGDSDQTAGLRMLVRGDREGQICQLRPQAAAALPRLFSACDEAQHWNLITAADAVNTTACIAALREAAASNTSLAGVFPFNMPPVATGLGPNANPDIACPSGSFLTSWFGGECIDCTNAVIGETQCTCYPGFISNIIGPSACGPPINPTGNATDAAGLAVQLCTQYSSLLDKMMQGQLSDRLVNSMYLEAFRRQAAYLMDGMSIYEATVAFWRAYIVDERMPSSPTRRRGIGPNCTACKDGKFKDIYTKKQVPVRDDRFKAINMFRFFGYLLHAAGSTCPRLWDPQDPLRWMYGRHDRTMCAYM